MTRTLVASALAMAFGISGMAWAADNTQDAGLGSNYSTDTQTFNTDNSDSSTRTRSDGSST